jgi:hypothetical protein
MALLAVQRDWQTAWSRRQAGVDVEVVERAEQIRHEQRQPRACAGEQRPHAPDAVLPFLLMLVLLAPRLHRALLGFDAGLLRALPRFGLEAPGLLLEGLALDSLEQGVDARLLRMLVERQHAEAMQRSDLLRQHVLGRRRRAGDQDRNHVQARRRQRRIGEARRAQAQRFRDLVADPVGAAEPRLERVDPAWADDDENDVGGLQGIVDH